MIAPFTISLKSSLIVHHLSSPIAAVRHFQSPLHMN